MKNSLVIGITSSGSLNNILFKSTDLSTRFVTYPDGHWSFLF